MSEIVIPELAESITEGTIAEWLVKEGDVVEKDTPILELETDKINLEINAETEGIITEITKPVGSDVVVGDVIGVVGDKESFTGLNEESSDNDQDAEFSTIKDKEKEKETEYEIGRAQSELQSRF